MLSCQLVEIRYSLNGISESQMNLLFSLLDQLDSQVIIKRLTDKAITLSPDDIILEGIFTPSMVGSLSRAFPPPLSFKVDLGDVSQLQRYSSFEWQPSSQLFCGVSLLPFADMQEILGFDNAWQYLRLLTTSEAGSILRPWLAVKPKGLLSVSRQTVECILPMHRMDILLRWFEYLQHSVVDANWLSGITGEITEEQLKYLGKLDKSRLPVLKNLVERTPTSDDIDFAKLFSRAMVAVS